jgi:glycosyltransferase involved in cell wall biosynthesis
VENGIPFFAPWWQRAPVVCLVHHVHTDQWAMQFPAPVARFGRWLEATVMPRAYRRAEFVAVSASTARAVAGLGVADERITTIEMGLTPVPTTGVRSSSPRFLVLGRLVPHKRVEVALRVWPRVRDATGGELVVVGDGPEMARLRALAGPGVTFTGAVDEARKGAELGAAWLLVHPAHHEGWGTVVMEAAAAGVPTVGFDVPGVRDSVVDGVTGLLARDEAGFAEAWIALATDADRRAAMAEAARARAATFTWDRAVDAFEAVLQHARRRA